MTELKFTVYHRAGSLSSSTELPGRVEIIRNSKTATIMEGFVSEQEQPSQIGIGESKFEGLV